MGVNIRFSLHVSKTVERTDNHTAFVIIKCKMKCSFHNLSSFDYIVTKEFILYECADLGIKKDTNLSIDVLISTSATPQMY